MSVWKAKDFAFNAASHGDKMLIQQKRVRDLSKRLIQVTPATVLIPALRHLESQAEQLKLSGFSDLKVGATVLPGDLGPISRFNSEGKVVVRKDLPMETAYRRIEWTWKQWRGRDATEEVTEFRDRPYRRYPREFIEPPSIELTVAEDERGDLLVVAPQQVWNPRDQVSLIHTVNLFLELFGECELMTSRLDGILLPATRRLNWDILPEGVYPWEKLRPMLEPIINREPEGNRPVIRHHFEVVNSHGPDFTAIGRGGFGGYVVFGFTGKDLYVLESTEYGNATYVFTGDWEALSRLTKAEILQGGLQEDRVIHLKGWEQKIEEILA